MDCSVVAIQGKPGRVRRWGGLRRGAADTPAAAPQFLVSTTDFFYPLVKDPYRQGRIAACNVLSDIYAMGIVEVRASAAAAVAPLTRPRPPRAFPRGHLRMHRWTPCS